MPETTIKHSSEFLSTEAPGDSSVNDRTAKFNSDLRRLFRSLGIREPEEYLLILSKQFDDERRNRIHRDAEFSRDLRKLYSGIAPESSYEHLVKLGAVFNEWRRYAKEELKLYFVDLPEDDPLCCPISVFGVMQQGRLEVAQTQVLTWLLDPRKEHGFGAVLLHALLQSLGTQVECKDIHVEKIQAELPIDDGRLDVFVQGRSHLPDGETESWLLLIEAKIDAIEGEQQLRRYDKWLRRYAAGRMVYRVFLTQDGRDADTNDETWTSYSFLKLACTFRSVYRTLKHAHGYHFLRFYLSGLLSDVCHWKLPLTDPESCDDPYSFIEYLKTVRASEG